MGAKGATEEDIQEMEKAASKGGDHRRRNGGYVIQVAGRVPVACERA